MPRLTEQRLIQMEDWVSTANKNPFPPDSTRFGPAQRNLQEIEKDLPNVLRQLMESGNRRAAKNLVLAIGHLQARSEEGLSFDKKETFFSDHHVPKQVAEALGRDKLYGLLKAADRANQELSKFRGKSKAADCVRRDTWKLCFGDSLADALDIAPIVQKVNVLILGPSGTGKEIIAKTIASATIIEGKADPKFESLNVAAIPPQLAESLLFGHARGSFTGAERSHGAFARANGGAIFLDEVADLDPSVQPKLLRAIQERKVDPLGGPREDAKVRVISATSRDVEERLRLKLFREDLYYRLATCEIEIPPLDERRDDIEEIGRKFLDDEIGVRGVDHPFAQRKTEALEWLAGEAASERSWAGNVRSVQNELLRFMLGFAKPERRAFAAIPPSPATTTAEQSAGAREDADLVPADIVRGTATLDRAKTWYVAHAARLHEHNISRTAESLDVHRATVAGWLKGKSS